MTSIDEVHIHFNPNELSLLNICLGFLMFGLALDIKKKDFELLWQQPKAAIVGLSAQLFLVPILTIALIHLFHPPTSVALGMILVAACPGGNVSNYSTHMAKGNTALAITTTSFSTLAAMFTTPLIFAIGASFVPNVGNLKQDISIQPINMIGIVAKLMAFPLLMGMFLQHQYPKLVETIKKPVKILSFIIFIAFILLALLANSTHFVEYVSKIFVLVLVYNALALATGYGFAKLNGLSEKNARAITFETGIHNTALGLLLIFKFFGGLGGMALIAAWYGIWDLITAFGLAAFWSRRNPELKNVTYQK
jgi:bile acid:Na+ symporter, BASS family